MRLSIKMALVGGMMMWGLVWTDARSQSDEPAYNPDDYVGTETCAMCHEDVAEAFALTVHAKMDLFPDLRMDKKGCEACHGPGTEHLEAGGDDPDLMKATIRTFENVSPKDISEACLKCHAGKEEHNNYKRGEHWRNDVGCVDCHAPHAPGTPTRKMLSQQQPALCITCHAEVQAQFSLPFRHRVLEGAILCTDCHNPHGGFELKQVRLATGADMPCMKCHTDKQGPFVFEHAPLKFEGCAICHNPHGSTNPRLLKRSTVNQLCLECHSDTGTLVAPSTTGFHDQATLRFQNCTTCHVKIHGSNDNTFFIR